MPCRPAISSMSLGRAWVHKLPHKLDMAARYGYAGIELFYEDLEYYTREHYSNTDPASLVAAAKDIRKLCSTRDLAIICLQPFMHYGGLRDREEHRQKIETMRLWFRLAHALGTDLIQLPSSFLPAAQVDPSLDNLISDMIEVADLGAAQQPPLRFGFESLCWGTYVDLWETSWEVVSRVNRPNFGLCLDTYNIAGRVYADPTRKDGKTPNADADMAASVQRLREMVDPCKIFFIQVVDAERLQSPLLPGHEYYDEDQPARMSWSRNCRCFYREENRGAYLPVKEICRAILDKEKGLGFNGWVSMELFSRTMNDGAVTVPEEHARRGMESWERLRKDVDMDVEGVEEDESSKHGIPQVDGGYEAPARKRNVVDTVSRAPLLTA